MDWAKRGPRPFAGIAPQLKCSVEEAEATLAAARATLMTARKKRPAPHLDDKVLTSWNGLMVRRGQRRGVRHGFVPLSTKQIFFQHSAALVRVVPALLLAPHTVQQRCFARLDTSVVYCGWSFSERTACTWRVCVG